MWGDLGEKMIVLSAESDQHMKVGSPFLDAIASPSTYPLDSMSEWVMFSDFGDSYCIYRACEPAF